MTHPTPTIVPDAEAERDDNSRIVTIIPAPPDVWLATSHSTHVEDVPLVHKRLAFFALVDAPEYADETDEIVGRWQYVEARAIDGTELHSPSDGPASPCSLILPGHWTCPGHPVED